MIRVLFVAAALMIFFFAGAGLQYTKNWPFRKKKR